MSLMLGLSKSVRSVVDDSSVIGLQLVFILGQMIVGAAVKIFYHDTSLISALFRYSLFY